LPVAQRRLPAHGTTGCRKIRARSDHGAAISRAGSERRPQVWEQLIAAGLKPTPCRGSSGDPPGFAAVIWTAPWRPDRALACFPMLGPNRTFGRIGLPATKYHARMWFWPRSGYSRWELPWAGWCGFLLAANCSTGDAALEHAWAVRLVAGPA